MVPHVLTTWRRAWSAIGYTVVTDTVENVNVCDNIHVIGNVWIYRLLFFCFLREFTNSLFVRLRISPARIKLALSSNFAR